MNIAYVYVISFEDPVIRKLNPYVKIGKTVDLQSRIKGIQTGSPMKLKSFGYIETKDPNHVERFLHKQLASHRVNGEWFQISSRLVKTITGCYHIYYNELNDLLSSVEDTPESRKIKSLEDGIKHLNMIIASKDGAIKELHEDFKINGLSRPSQRSASMGHFRRLCGRK